MKPQCTNCIHGRRRGNFYLCKAGEHGYRRIGEEVKCDKYKEKEDVLQNNH